MKKKMVMIILFALCIAMIAACAGPEIIEQAAPEEPEILDEEIDIEIEELDSNVVDITDIMAKMAGIWRMDYSNPDNTAIMVLNDDGTWEGPGPLPTDHTSGGSFYIINEESGIYDLSFVIEHTDSPSVEIGNTLGWDYKYDEPNDVFFAVLHSGEGASNANFIRMNVSSVNELYELSANLDEPSEPVAQTNDTDKPATPVTTTPDTTKPATPATTTPQTNTPAEPPSIDMVQEKLAGGWMYAEMRRGFRFYGDGTASADYGSEPAQYDLLYGIYTIVKQNDNDYLIEFEITDDMSKHEQIWIVNKTTTFRYNFANDTLVNLTPVDPVGADGESKMVRFEGTMPRS